MGRTVVAVDLGSSGVRAVQFTARRGHLTAQKAGWTPLPDGAIVNGEIVDPATVVAALKTLWQQHKFSTKQVAFAVANNEVLVRQMDLDWAEPAAFRKALRFHVDEALGLDIDTLNLDYHVLAETDETVGDTTVRKSSILLVAATTTMVDKFVAVFRDAGLLPVHADLLPFALVRAAGTAGPETTEAVVEIRSDITTVVIHSSGQPKFVRIIAEQGGNNITDALLEHFGGDRADAEKAKAALGLSSHIATDTDFDDSAFAVATAAEPTEEHPAQAVITAAAANLIAEIRDSIAYYLSENPDVETLARVVLSGGGSRLKGLTGRLANELRLPVEIADPFAGVTLGKDVTANLAGLDEQQLTVAVGLALGEPR